MRSRVRPLDGGAPAMASKAASAPSAGRHSGSGEAAPVRPTALQGRKRKATKEEIANPGQSHKQRGRKATKHRKKRQLAVAGVAVGLSALALVLSVCMAIWSKSVPPASSGADSSDVDAAGRFLDWFHAAGGRADGLGVAQFPGMGTGVAAQRDIHQDDVMLFVPKSIIMCSDTIFASPAPRAMLRSLETLRGQEDELLTAFLLLEQLQGEASRWAPYLQLLPQMPLPMTSGYDAESVASPLFFADDDHVEHLQDAHMIESAREERSRAQRGYRRFKRLIGKALASNDSSDRLLSYERYVWARFLINSRAFSIQGRRFLVPFGDLFNGQSQQQARAHDNGRHFLKFHELQSAGMVVRADRDTSRAHQVFEDYGDNDNYIYSLFHGFIMPDNAFDCTVVRLPPLSLTAADGQEAGSGVLEMKTRVLRHFGVVNGPEVCVSADGRVREAPLARFYSTLHRMSAERMRFECDQPDKYAQCFLAKESSDSLAIDSPSSDTRRFIGDAVRHQLAAYPTTLSLDERLIYDHEARQTAGGSPWTQREPNIHAVRFRASRKRILQSAIASLTGHIGDAATNDGGDGKPTDMEVATAEVPDSQRDGRFERFQEWIETLAFPINHLEMRYIDDVVGYGTFATNALQEGEVYLRVPISAVMNVRSAFQSPSRWIPRVSRALGSAQTADVWLTLHLLDEKFGPRSPQSRWKPYLDMLPSLDAGRMGSPLFYPEGGAEMQLLARTDLLPLVERYRERVLAMYSSLSDAIQTLTSTERDRLSEWLTLDRFLWANAVMDSRSIWWGGQRHLVPLLDMVNCLELAPNKAHKAHETRVTGDGMQFADTRASWAFAAGDEVVENYGQPNYIYLLYHGFVLERNSHDCAHVRVDFAATFQDGNDGANDMERRRRVAERLEALGVSAWQWDECVAVDNGASVDRLARLALFAVNPTRALGGVGGDSMQQEQAAAALQLVQTRLDKLGPPSAHREGADGVDCSHCGVVDAYVDQQRRQLQQLRDRFAAVKQSS